MTSTPADGASPRLAELIGGLSLATDLAAGLGLESALRTSVLAVGIARETGIRGAELSDVYYTALLRFIGCTAFAHETAWTIGGGDDQGTLRALSPLDTADPRDLLRGATLVGKSAGTWGRLRAAARFVSDPNGMSRFSTAHCALAQNLAARLDMTAQVVSALGQIYERFDGKGHPRRLKAKDILLPARVLHVACRVEMQRGLIGPDEAIDVVRERRGKELDPDLAGAFLKRNGELLERVAAPSVWEEFLASEPAPSRRISRDRTGEIAEAFARFVDVKSPFTLNHSSGVARLAADAARSAGRPTAEVESIRISGFLHDIGRVSVPNGIWDKPGALSSVERERARQHTYQTERILTQSPIFREYSALAGLHHERLDGSGYYRGISGPAIPFGARLLAAADAWHAMTESRAYRPAMTPSDASKQLAEEARSGRYDREAVEAVLAAAGQRDTRVRGGWPKDLSDREVEVLRLLARGLSNKKIGRDLFISSRTVQQHVRHIYEKTGISTRAAAALFAVENSLLEK
jgi:HD-GYP domain-containing protein (c-di-GMP phosphodiesterase class II)